MLLLIFLRFFPVEISNCPIVQEELCIMVYLFKFLIDAHINRLIMSESQKCKIDVCKNVSFCLTCRSLVQFTLVTNFNSFLEFGVLCGTGSSIYLVQTGFAETKYLYPALTYPHLIPAWNDLSHPHGECEGLCAVKTRVKLLP